MKGLRTDQDGPADGTYWDQQFHGSCLADMACLRPLPRAQRMTIMTIMERFAEKGTKCIAAARTHAGEVPISYCVLAAQVAVRFHGHASRSAPVLQLRPSTVEHLSCAKIPVDVAALGLEGADMAGALQRSCR